MLTSRLGIKNLIVELGISTARTRASRRAVREEFRASAAWTVKTVKIFVVFPFSPFFVFFVQFSSIQEYAHIIDMHHVEFWGGGDGAILLVHFLHPQT